MKGEDNYYKNNIKNIKGYSPIQLGFFSVNCETKQEFLNLICDMKKRVEIFVKKNWNDIDDCLFSEITENITTIDRISEIKVMLIKYNVEEKIIYVILNHGRVGGGDYLLLGSVMFNGITNSLIEEPKKNILTFLQTNIAKYYFQIYLIKYLFFKKPRDRFMKEEIIESKIFLSGKKKVKKKYILIHKILTNIMASVKDTEELVCWIPVGFIKTPSSPNNNIGIILFVFKKNMSLEKLEVLIEGSKYFAIGSHQLLIDSYYYNSNYSKYSTNIENKLKKNIDVVLTLANIFDNKININSAMGGMYYKMNKEGPYPYYIWGMTMNNVTYLTYSIADKLCNIDKLIINTNGNRITDKYIFELNKNKIIESNL